MLVEQHAREEERRNMNQQPYEALCEAIRAKCQHDGWYGGEFYSPRWAEVEANDPCRSGFEFAQATHAQIQATEAMLGFSLLPLLKTLYTRLANGGFGPAGGLRGVLGGFESLGSGYVPRSDDTLPAAYLFWSRKRAGEIDLSDSMLEQLQEQKMIEIPRGFWPRHLLPVCDLGDVQEACVDNSNGQMFEAAAVYDDRVYGLQQKPYTFEEWLWQWARTSIAAHDYV
jgi:hypothetical protein